MSEQDSTFDAAVAGRSIKDAFDFLRGTFVDVSTLLSTVDSQFSSSEQNPPWRDLAPYAAITWENSSAHYAPEKWIPRYFIRVWWEDGEAEREGCKAAVLHLTFDDAGEEEPWIGCYLIESLAPFKGNDWSYDWFRNLEGSFEVRWTGKDKEAFFWSDAKEESGIPCKICGYYLNLTDVRSADDVRALIVEPLVKLAKEWNVEVLPRPR